MQGRSQDKRTVLGPFGKELLHLGLVLELLAVLHLQPALSRDVSVLVLVFVERRQELGHATDGRCAPLLGRVVGRWNPSQRRPRREEREQVGRELVRHGRLFQGCKE